NNIVYIDSIYDSSNQVVFKAENLLTRKYKVLTMKIDENNGFYPFYDTIILSKDRLEVKTNTEAKSISITDIKLK
ncbi:MAG TPA: hypothetical protein VL947_12315, partial [Cytophagales bacterium]|nr:hypothetical protein [Cytophagales bacterium]